MNDQSQLKSLLDRISKEIEVLEEQKTEFMDRINDIMKQIQSLHSNRDSICKVMEMIEKDSVFIEPELPTERKEEQSPKDGKGMTASTLKLLASPGVFLSVREVLDALEQAGYKTKRVNVYVMLKRLVEKGKIEARDERGILKYGLVIQKEKGPAVSEQDLQSVAL